MFLFKTRRLLQLEGKKISLRPLQKNDFPSIHPWFEDPEIMELAFGLPQTDNNFPNLVRSYRKEIETNQQSFFAVMDKLERLIGFSSYTIFDRQRRARIGILIGLRQYWNKGYGRDAVMTLLRYLFVERGVRVVELDTARFNLRAQRCFQSCGFKRVHKEWFDNSDRLWYELQKEDFLRIASNHSSHSKIF